MRVGGVKVQKVNVMYLESGEDLLERDILLLLITWQERWMEG
jgi:hypothetical protein